MKRVNMNDKSVNKPFTKKTKVNLMVSLQERWRSAQSAGNISRNEELLR